MITLRNLTLRRGPKVVLQGATVTLNPGEKVGLVGRNGAGKSSLFALLAGRLHADAGDFEVPAHWRLLAPLQNAYVFLHRPCRTADLPLFNHNLWAEGKIGP